MSNIPDRIFIRSYDNELAGAFTSDRKSVSQIEYIRAETVQSERAEIVAALKGVHGLLSGSDGSGWGTYAMEDSEFFDHAGKIRDSVSMLLAKLEGGAK